MTLRHPVPHTLSQSTCQHIWQDSRHVSPFMRSLLTLCSHWEDCLRIPSALSQSTCEHISQDTPPHWSTFMVWEHILLNENTFFSMRAQSSCALLSLCALTFLSLESVRGESLISQLPPLTLCSHCFLSLSHKEETVRGAAHGRDHTYDMMALKRSYGKPVGSKYFDLLRERLLSQSPLCETVRGDSESNTWILQFSRKIF